jgi:hypothetical protein
MKIGGNVDWLTLFLVLPASKTARRQNVTPLCSGMPLGKKIQKETTIKLQQKETYNMKERVNTLMTDSKSGRLIAGLCLILLCWTVPALGAHPLVSDDTGTQGKGKTQIEITGQYDRGDEEGLKTEIWEAKATLIYGLFAPVDLILEAPYNWISTKNDERITQDGFADLLVALKWRFFEQNGLSFAIKPAVTLPTGDEEKGLGNGRASYGFGFITTYAKDSWAFHLNLGVTHND